MTRRMDNHANAVADDLTRENTTLRAAAKQDVIIEHTKNNDLTSDDETKTEQLVLEELDLASAALQSLHEARHACRKFFATRPNSSRSAIVRNALASSADIVDQAISASCVGRRSAVTTGDVEKKTQCHRVEKTRHQFDEIDALLQQAAHQVEQEKDFVQRAEEKTRRTKPMKMGPRPAVVDSTVVRAALDKPLVAQQLAPTTKAVPVAPPLRSRVVKGIERPRATAIKRPAVDFVEGQAMYGEDTEEFRIMLMDKICHTCLHSQYCSDKADPSKWHICQPWRSELEDPPHKKLILRGGIAVAACREAGMHTIETGAGVRMVVHVRTSCFTVYKRPKKTDICTCERGHQPEDARLQAHHAWTEAKYQRFLRDGRPE